MPLVIPEVSSSAVSLSNGIASIFSLLPPNLLPNIISVLSGNPLLLSFVALQVIAVLILIFILSFIMFFLVSALLGITILVITVWSVLAALLAVPLILVFSLVTTIVWGLGVVVWLCYSAIVSKTSMNAVPGVPPVQDVYINLGDSLKNAPAMVSDGLKNLSTTIQEKIPGKAGINHGAEKVNEGPKATGEQVSKSAQDTADSASEAASDVTEAASKTAQSTGKGVNSAADASMGALSNGNSALKSTAQPMSNISQSVAPSQPTDVHPVSPPARQSLGPRRRRRSSEATMVDDGNDESAGESDGWDVHNRKAEGLAMGGSNEEQNLLRSIGRSLI